MEGERERERQRQDRERDRERDLCLCQGQDFNTRNLREHSRLKLKYIHQASHASREDKVENVPTGMTVPSALLLRERT